MWEPEQEPLTSITTRLLSLRKSLKGLMLDIDRIVAVTKNYPASTQQPTRTEIETRAPRSTLAKVSTTASPVDSVVTDTI